jgi:hypothetical protein
LLRLNDTFPILGPKSCLLRVLLNRDRFKCIRRENHIYIYIYIYIFINICLVFNTLVISQDNQWRDTSMYPLGGYLNDLWRYDFDLMTWTSLHDESGDTFELGETEDCVNDPGSNGPPSLSSCAIESDHTNEQYLDLPWPSSRAGPFLTHLYIYIYIYDLDTFK